MASKTDQTNPPSPTPPQQPANNRSAEPAEKRKRGTNPELQTLAKLDRIFAELTPAQARRCVDWIKDRHVETIEQERRDEEIRDITSAIDIRLAEKGLIADPRQPGQQ